MAAEEEEKKKNPKGKNAKKPTKAEEAAPEVVQETEESKLGKQKVLLKEQVEELRRQIDQY